MPTISSLTHVRSVAAIGAAWLACLACQGPSGTVSELSSRSDSLAVISEVEAAVWAFHAADTARDAEAVIALLWPEYYMLADGQRVGYKEIAQSSREFMDGLELFHTVWSDLRIVPVTSEAAISSFLFRDSIVTRDGELIQTQGPTTLFWERRSGEWRALFGDADHYPITP
jgi:ketosteroid isomerase-like protein